MKRLAIFAALLSLGVLLCACGSSKRKSDKEREEAGPSKERVRDLAKEGMPRLKEMLQSERALDRKDAIIALGYRADDPEAKALLLSIADEKNRDAEDVVVALALMGAPEAKGVIERFAESEKPNLRAAACYAIGEYGDSSLLPLLGSLRDDPERVVRNAAARISRQLTEGRDSPFAHEMK